MPTKRTSEKPADKKGGKNNQNSSQSTNTNMSKSAEHSYSDNRDTFCSMCDHEVSDDDPCIQCELCKSWFSLECIGMSEAFYNELVSSSHGDNVIWYCNGCKRAIPGVRKVLNAVTSIHTLQENMNKRLTSLEEKVNSKPSELIMDYKIDQAMYDFKEREKRRNNVIIYNLPKPSVQDNESKLEEEKEKINKICDNAEITSGFETASRLGEKRNEASNPRTLKVVLSDENSKQKLLKKSDSLKNVEELKKVTVTPDYTYRQRQMNKTMKQEVAKRRVTDPTYNYRTPSKSFGAHSATSSSFRNSLATTGNSATISNNSRSSHALPDDVLASKKSKAKFQNWLKARDRKPGDEGDRIIQHNNRSYDSSNYSNKVKDDEDGYCYHGDANVLRVSSARSPEYATPDPNWNSDDETGEITAAQLMSPEDFDTVADDIIARVKGDMTVKDGAKASKVEGNGAKLTSHICPNCEHLMVPPQHNPMLVIPCGHTLCRLCSRKSKYCCVCGCPVQSTTDNVMLQQIITDYQLQDMARKEEKQRNRKIYKEEYQNLQTRQEILQEESASISKNISKLSTKMTKEKQQIDSISKEEENIQSRIRTLQQQCQALTEHRREYERNYEELDNQSDSEKKRLVLVKNSLKSVQEQIEKVKLLAES